MTVAGHTRYAGSPCRGSRRAHSGAGPPAIMHGEVTIASTHGPVMTKPAPAGGRSDIYDWS